MNNTNIPNYECFPNRVLAVSEDGKRLRWATLSEVDLSPGPDTPTLADTLAKVVAVHDTQTLRPERTPGALTKDDVRAIVREVLNETTIEVTSGSLFGNNQRHYKVVGHEVKEPTS